MPWWAWALASALTASGTALLTKCAADDLPANLGAALRATLAVLLLWSIALSGGWPRWQSLTPKAMGLLVGAGLCTGLSWWAYFHALKLAEVSKVAPLDKLSLPLTLLGAWLLLGEAITPLRGAGVLLITIGTVLITRS